MMDLFKFTPPSSANATVLERGRIINGWNSVMWTERYDEPGEFEIDAPLSSDLRNFLPEGTLISHVDTLEVMIVENHQVVDSKGDNPTLKITGRSFVSYLENRCVGVNSARLTNIRSEVNLGSDVTWDQAEQLINNFIATPEDPDDILTNVIAVASVTGWGTTEARTIERGPLLERVLEILAVDDLGIKTIRVNDFPGEIGSETNTIIQIYRGVSKANKVIFSWSAGDFDTTEYLFSSKKYKNSALIVSKYFQTVYDTPGPVNYNRRFMLVDASDIDEHHDVKPTDAGEVLTIIGKMITRGKQKLKKQKRVTITRADVSNTSNYRYRRDYNLGDLVTLDADYNQSVVARVVEYVEIEDENGESGHPTLSLPMEEPT